MPNFFVADKTVVGKQKINNILKKNSRYRAVFQNIIIRNREASPIDINNLIRLENRVFKYFASSNIKCLRGKIYGIHISLFYDKLNSSLSSFLKLNKTISVHNKKEIILAKSRFDNIKFYIVSPVFATTSHPNSSSMGTLKLFKLINSTKHNNFIIMGGISLKKYKILKNLDFLNKIKGFATITNT